MISEVAAAVVAVIVVGSVAAIGVVEVVENRPFSEPMTLSFLAVAVVSFFYGSRGGSQVRQAVSNVTSALTNGSKSVAATTPGAPTVGA